MHIPQSDTIKKILAVLCVESQLVALICILRTSAAALYKGTDKKPFRATSNATVCISMKNLSAAKFKKTAKTSVA